MLKMESPTRTTLGEIRVSIFVAAGQVVSGWRGHAEAGEDGGLEPEPVADVVGSYRVGELGEKYRRERWLTTLQDLALTSTPISEAWRLISPRGMGLRICLRTTTLARADVAFHFTLPSGRDFNSAPARFSHQQRWLPVGWQLKFFYETNHETPSHRYRIPHADLRLACG